jgi:aspartyl/asparaginyl beta-hydroxylase
MLGLETSIRLPLTFDPERLQKDLKAIEHVHMQSHYGGYHDGKWSAIGLVSQGGQSDELHVGTGKYEKTEIVKNCPYFNEVLDTFACDKQRVRLMALAPGGKIFEHWDSDETIDSGIARIHIPIVTHKDVVFVLAGRRVRWMPGEVWYGDFSFPHHLENRSNVNRVHMVLDLVVNDFLIGLFPKGYVEQKTWRRYARKAHLTACAYRMKLQGRSPGAA